MARTPPKKPPTRFSEADLIAFLSQSSDFAFEMATLSALRSLDFFFEHAATYTDPITNKIRAYDIRARWLRPERAIRFAIECKNLQPDSPLLVHATPRLYSEAYHTILLRVVRNETLYPPRPHRLSNVYSGAGRVGRYTDQPSKDANGVFKSSDSGTFEKWLQAVNGCYELVKETADAPIQTSQAGAVVPMLVVPDHTLWQVDYDERGEVVEAVRKVERTTLILRHTWQIPTRASMVVFDISHLEIVTLSAVRQRAMTLLSALLADTDELLSQ